MGGSTRLAQATAVAQLGSHQPNWGSHSGLVGEDCAVPIATGLLQLSLFVPLMTAVVGDPRSLVTWSDLVCGPCTVGQRRCRLRHGRAMPEVLPGSPVWAGPRWVPCPCPLSLLLVPPQGSEPPGVLGVHPQPRQWVLGTVVGGARLLATPVLRGSPGEGKV